MHYIQNILPKLFSATVVFFITIDFLGGVEAQTSSIQDIPPPQTYGAWTKQCSLPIGTPNVECLLIQNIRAQNRPDMFFRISFLKLPKDDSLLMRLYTPARVELRLGIPVKIDGHEIGRMEYRRCFGNTCVAEAILDKTTFANFLHGRQAIYTVFPAPQMPAEIIVSLNGITAGYKTLTAPKQIVEPSTSPPTIKAPPTSKPAIATP
ncbi:invasion associated locus B family protein [Bartonella sp. DGB2]|uniref:invasion associated locus B family protein n=1 Tax=Bartonella sp. DGB2 TaxID=3388426 RepID=UPI0039900047